MTKPRLGVRVSGQLAVPASLHLPSPQGILYPVPSQRRLRLLLEVHYLHLSIAPYTLSVMSIAREHALAFRRLPKKPNSIETDMGLLRAYAKLFIEDIRAKTNTD